VHAVWWRRWNGNSGPSEIWYRRSTDNGVTWGEEALLDSDGDASMYPSVAVFGSLRWGIYFLRSRDERNGPIRIVKIR
jgi:hypothetical protein